MSGITPSLTLRCIVADDEPFAREGMRQLIAEVPFLELAGMAADAAGVIRLLDAGGADLLFLDIEMPGLSGIDLAKGLPGHPPIVFTTAFPEYAVQGYELDILDYLLKPITLQRFLKAAYKARAYYEKQGPMQKPGFLFVKTNKRLERVRLEDILLVEARLNYVLIHLERSKIMTYGSIKSMVEKLPQPEFLKVHKSFIVSLARIDRMEGNTLWIGGAQVPVSRECKTQVLEWITNSGSPSQDPS
jgi:DNA-binding LytR/AlgR family response regulator